MLWNWTTIDACFLSKSWHVRTMGQFAGSVVGVFFLCMAIEAIRRAAREYDRRITLGARIEATAKGSKRVEVTWVQQAIVSGVGGVVAWWRVRQARSRRRRAPLPCHSSFRPMDR